MLHLPREKLINILKRLYMANRILGNTGTMAGSMRPSAGSALNPRERYGLYNATSISTHQLALLDSKSLSKESDDTPTVHNSDSSNVDRKPADAATAQPGKVIVYG
jgi:hypothetical protein